METEKELLEERTLLDIAKDFEYPDCTVKGIIQSLRVIIFYTNSGNGMAIIGKDMKVKRTFYYNGPVKITPEQSIGCIQISDFIKNGSFYEILESFRRMEARSEGNFEIIEIHSDMDIQYFVVKDMTDITLNANMIAVEYEPGKWEFISYRNW